MSYGVSSASLSGSTSPPDVLQFQSDLTATL
jgi:hypothetical protein